MMYLVWSVVELPVELARVEVGEELLELAGHVHVGVLGEHVHVPEAVDSNERQVLLLFAEMVQRVSEFDSVSNQEVDVFCNNSQN